MRETDDCREVHAKMRRAGWLCAKGMHAEGMMIVFLEGLLWTLRFLTGASIFSFINVVIYRLPEGESLVRGRSHCRSCGHVLSAGELIPCISYLLLRGRCSACGGRIAARYFWIECAGGAAFCCCAAAFTYGTASLISVQGLTVFAYLAVLAAAAGIDRDTQIICDCFQWMILALGVCAVWLFPETGLLERGIGAVVISVPMLLLTLLIPGAFGGGDIKLAAVSGWFLGAKAVVVGTFFAFLLGGGYAIWMLAGKKLGRKDRFAFGPFLAAGYTAAVFVGERIADWYIGLL